MATIGKPAKLNLFRLVSKWVLVIGFGVISMNSKFEPCSSLNGWYNSLVPGRQWRHLQMILSYPGHQHSCINTLKSKPIRCCKIFSFNFGHQGGIRATCKWSYHVEQIDKNLSISNNFIHSSGIILNSIFGHQGGISITWKWSYRVRKINMAV